MNTKAIIDACQRLLTQFEFDGAAEAIKAIRLVAGLQSEDAARLADALRVKETVVIGLITAARGACSAVDGLVAAGQPIEPKSLCGLVEESWAAKPESQRAAGAFFLLMKVKGWSFIRWSVNAAYAAGTSEPSRDSGETADEPRDDASRLAEDQPLPGQIDQTAIGAVREILSLSGRFEDMAKALTAFRTVAGIENDDAQRVADALGTDRLAVDSVIRTARSACRVVDEFTAQGQGPDRILLYRLFEELKIGKLNQAERAGVLLLLYKVKQKSKETRAEKG